MTGGLKNRIVGAIAGATRRFHPRGTNRLITRLYHPDRRRLDYLETVMRYDNRLRIKIDTRDFIEWQIFFYGYYEPELVREIKRVFRPGHIAFDIGANVGAHTLIMGDLAGETGQVFAVEPNPRAYRRLLENIELNLSGNITPISWAFSDRRSRSRLFVPVEGTANRGVASLYAANVGYRQEEVTVEVRTIDQVVGERGLSRLDFIKVDTEGNELKVLRGGRESIARFRPVVVFEYDRRTWNNSGTSYEEVADYLARLGYAVSLIGRRSLRPIGKHLPPIGNFLARPAGKPAPPGLEL